MKNKTQSDVIQYLVSFNHARFNYVDVANLSLLAYDEDSFKTDELGNDDDEGSNSSAPSVTSLGTLQDDGAEESDGEYKRSGGGGGGMSNVVEDGAVEDYDDVKMEETLDADQQQELDYMTFCLKPDEVLEGLLCNVTGPNRMTLMVKKIDGFDLSPIKDEMQSELNELCEKLPELDNVVTGDCVLPCFPPVFR